MKTTHCRKIIALLILTCIQFPAYGFSFETFDAQNNSSTLETTHENHASVDADTILNSITDSFTDGSYTSPIQQNSNWQTYAENIESGEENSEQSVTNTILDSIVNSFNDGSFKSPIPENTSWQNFASTLKQITTPEERGAIPPVQGKKEENRENRNGNVSSTDAKNERPPSLDMSNFRFAPSRQEDKNTDMEKKTEEVEVEEIKVWKPIFKESEISPSFRVIEETTQDIHAADDELLNNLTYLMPPENRWELDENQYEHESRDPKKTVVIVQREDMTRTEEKKKPVITRIIQRSDSHDHKEDDDDNSHDNEDENQRLSELKLEAQILSLQIKDQKNMVEKILENMEGNHENSQLMLITIIGFQIILLILLILYTKRS